MTFNKDEFKHAEDAAYKANASMYTVQGFRKGKAPKAIIEKNYGENVFKMSAVEHLFGDGYRRVMQEHPEIKPVDHPSVELKSDLEITATIDTEPEFTLGNYTGLEVKKTRIKVTEEEVEEYLSRLAASRARQVAASKDHTIKNGNIAVIDFVGSVNGVEFNGGTAKNHELEIGSRSFIDTFEEQLIGYKIGDKPEITVNFPKEYHEKSLAGQKALFKVEIQNILIRQVPEINDSLAKEASEFDNLADFKQDIKARLETQALRECEHEDETNLLKLVIDQTDVKIPAKLTEHQLHHHIHDLERRLSGQGLNLESYAKYLNATVEELKDKMREQAELGVKSRFVFDAIIQKEGLKADKQEIDAETKKFAESTGSKISDFTKDPRRMTAIEQEIVFNKLVMFLTKNNKFI
jgi:trigger factor